MPWQELWIAVALLLVMEGIFPFVSPDGLREALRRISSLSNPQLRLAGLGSMLTGLAVLYLVR